MGWGQKCAGPSTSCSEQQSSFSESMDVSLVLQLFLFSQVFTASRGEEGAPEKHLGTGQHLMRQHRGPRPGLKVLDS